MKSHRTAHTMQLSIYKITVLILCLGWSSAEYSCDSKLPDDVRHKIIDFHNDLRSKLAKGMVDGANGTLKPAKNMYGLDWDCRLERIAAQRCRNGRIETNFLYLNGAAADIVVGSGCYPKPLNFEKDFKKSMEKWWSGAKRYAQPENNRLTDFSLEDFGQMANGNATKVGCSFDKGGRLTSILCIYDSRLRKGSEVYQVGDACKTDADCTTIPDSTCVQKTGLCKA